MTPPKRITFLAKRIGEFFILIFVTCFLQTSALAQEQTFHVADLRRLAKQFRQTDQPFLSYAYNLAFYHLTKDSTEKFQAGLEALRTSIATSHFDDGKKVLDLLVNDFPGCKNYLTYQYGYLLIRSGQYGKGDTYIRDFQDVQMLSDRVKFLRAYAQLTYFNYPEGSVRYLSQIEGENFPYPNILSDIKTAMNTRPPGTKKYKAIAIPFSVVLPGSGQFYAGFYFDGVQSLGFNLILGYATYVSWRHELDRPRGDRNLTLPILSSAVSGLFYLSNIYNTINAVDKANLYRQNKHHSAILEKFRVVLKDDGYFLDVRLHF